MGSHVESVPTLCWLTKMDGGRSSWKPEKYLGRSAHSSVHQWLIASYQADRTAESYLQQFRRQGHRPAQPPINTSSSHIFNFEFLCSPNTANVKDCQLSVEGCILPDSSAEPSVLPMLLCSPQLCPFGGSWHFGRFGWAESYSIGTPCITTFNSL